MKVSLDSSKCRGHGVCGALSPEMFELTDDGYSIALTPEVPEGLEAVVIEAVRQCPEKAISTR